MRLIPSLAAVSALVAVTAAASAQTAYQATAASAALGAPPTPSAREVGLRFLTWPGKVEPTHARPEPAAPPQHRIWNPAPQPPAPEAAPAPARRVEQAALPASIYAPPPPKSVPPAPAAAQPAPTARVALAPAASPAAGDYQPPHFYSLYREYGQKPDPIPASEFDPKAGSVPLQAQFFASSTPDLANPPPPVPHAVTTSGGRVISTVPPSPDDNPG